MGKFKKRKHIPQLFLLLLLLTLSKSLFAEKVNPSLFHVLTIFWEKITKKIIHGIFHDSKEP